VGGRGRRAGGRRLHGPDGGIVLAWVVDNQRNEYEGIMPMSAISNDFGVHVTQDDRDGTTQRPWITAGQSGR